MGGVKQDPGSIDVLPRIRSDSRIKQEVEKVQAAQKRSRAAAEESDEIEVIASRRVKRPRSPLRQTSQSARECRTSSITTTQSNNEGNGLTSPASSDRPKTRLTKNGATLYICQHPGCGKSCRTLNVLRSHSEHAHLPAGNLEQRASPVPQVIYTSGAVVRGDESSPGIDVQNPRSEKESAQRAKPQPSRWRQRQNHPLFQSPDPSSLPIFERTLDLREGVKQLIADSSESVHGLLVPQDPTVPAPRAEHPDPQLGTFPQIGEAYQPAYVRLYKPQKCPVIVCGETFEYVMDLQYHKENGHRGQRLASSGNGCFHLINPETNQPCSDGEIRSFVCEDCGACFKGKHGLDFHKSRSTDCITPSTTHPALLIHSPIEASNEDTLSRVKPLILPKPAPYPNTATAAQTKDVSQGKTVQESTSLEQSKCTPMKGIQGTPVHQPIIIESREFARPEEIQDTTSRDTNTTNRLESAELEGSQGTTVQAANSAERRKPARLNLPTGNVPRANANAGDKKANNVGSRPSLEDLGLSSESSDFEVPLMTRRMQTCKVSKGRGRGKKLPPDPDSWEEATDADRRLVVQGLASTKWRVLQQAWHRATGLPTGVPALKLRFHRLASIIGDEAKRHSHSYIDSEGESEGEAEHLPTTASMYANARVTRGGRVVRKHLGFPFSWEQASKADKRLVAMKEKGHMWRTIREEYQTTIGRYMSQETLKKRVDRLVQLREGVIPYPKELLSNSGMDAPKEKYEHRGQNQTKEDHKIDDDKDDSSDNGSVYEISDDSSEDEGPISILERRSRHDETNKEYVHVDQHLEHHTTEGLGILNLERDPAKDPERMLAAMKAGESRWPRIREDWENAAGRKTPTNDIAKQNLELFNDADMSLLLAAEAVVEARFARAKYAMIADIMRANGAEEHKAAFVEDELRRLSKSATLSTESGNNSRVAPKPDLEVGIKNIPDFETNLSAFCAQQMAALAEAHRDEMHKTLDLVRQETGNVGSTVARVVRNVMDACLKRNEMPGPNSPSAEVLGVQPANGIGGNGPDSRQANGELPTPHSTNRPLAPQGFHKHGRNPSIQSPKIPTSPARRLQQAKADPLTCRRCLAKFESRIKLHHHLTSQNHYGPP